MTKTHTYLLKHSGRATIWAPLRAASAIAASAVLRLAALSLPASIWQSAMRHVVAAAAMVESARLDKSDRIFLKLLVNRWSTKTGDTLRCHLEEVTEKLP